METTIDISKGELDNLVAVIKQQENFDFGGYAPTSFSRRISRYIEKNKLVNVDNLIQQFKLNKVDFTAFVNEVTVNTTDLFRDPGFWFQFRKRLVKKFQKLDEIRIWHAACSSGEEMISMAILLKEEGLLHKTKFLGTDINLDILKTAQEQRYHSWRLNQYEKNYQQFEGKGRLSDYYSKDGNYIKFNKDLLANATFKPFNLIKEEQYQRFDLIMCRNVLIYFNKDQQESVINMLTKSIDGKGYLVLGAQESISWHKSADNFLAISNDFKIFKKLRS